jgi:hypothetical protein
LLLVQHQRHLLHKLISSDAAAEDHFGFSVDISGRHVIVGSRFDDDHGDKSGAAYLFDINGTQIRKFVAPDTQRAHDNRFGVAVAIDGAYIVIGARADETLGTDAGAAYLFQTDGTFIAKLLPEGGSAYMRFGWSVAIEASYGRVAVGAYREDVDSTGGCDRRGDLPRLPDGGPCTGSVYLFDLQGVQQVKVVAVDRGQKDNFGFSIALSGQRLLVGAYLHDANGTDAHEFTGAAYLYDVHGNHLKKLSAPDAAGKDVFGRDVALSGDHMLIGARKVDDVAFNAGSAYLFDINGTMLAKILPHDGKESDHFGHSVALSGGDMVVGSWRDDIDEGKDAAYVAAAYVDAGSAYIYH